MPRFGGSAAATQSIALKGEGLRILANPREPAAPQVT